MFFVDKPYVSDFFKQTVKENGIPVVDTPSARQLGLCPGTETISEARAVKRFENSETPLLYMTSENAIDWVNTHLAATRLPEKIQLFKDKVQFRKMTAPLFPDLFFQEVRLEALETIQYDTLPKPFIIKPKIGFFSMAVHKVATPEQWRNVRTAILTEIEQVRDLYPAEVLETGSFIIEQCIEGEEYAVDLYFDATGKPVVVGILKHLFASKTDMSDRVYITSSEIIETNLAEFTDFAGRIGTLAGVKNFPVHIELRRTDDGTLVPIEINPMRFGGWCTTADLTFLAFGCNPYLCYYNQERPDWSELVRGREGKVFSIVVLNNATGMKSEDIAWFDYDKLLSQFEAPLEIRKIDHHRYPLFGFLFAETGEDNLIELETILNSDLTEFVTPQPPLPSTF